MTGLPARAAFLFAVVGAFALPVPELSGQELASHYRETADRIIEAATSSHFAYERLGEMVDRFGARFSNLVPGQIAGQNVWFQLIG